MAARYPAIDFTGIEIGFLEPGFGVLMARRAVQTLVAEFIRAGGRYVEAQVLPPTGDRLTSLRTSAGDTVAADAFVWTSLEYDVAADGTTRNSRAVATFPPRVFAQASEDLARTVRYRVSYRPEGDLACTAMSRRVRFTIPN